MSITTKGTAPKTRWGWTDWLLVAASAGLCALAWRLVGDVRQLRDENESDIRTLRDEYARLERERAELHRQLTSVTERLAVLEVEPAPPALAIAPIVPVNDTQDAATEVSIANDSVPKSLRSPRRTRNIADINGTDGAGTATPRKPRARKSAPSSEGDANQNGTVPS